MSPLSRWSAGLRGPAAELGDELHEAPPPPREVAIVAPLDKEVPKAVVPGAMRVLNAYPLNLIVNADQTPLFLEMPAERTLEMKGARTVHVPTAGYEKERLTVMLAVTAGGMKLPPYVVFKRETLPKIPVPRGVVIRVQDKGWMDEKLVQDWAAQVLVPFLKSLREEGGQRKEALLVLDSYRGHITEAVGQTMKLFKLTCA
ncbi:unnamed protein product, partial [Closterium sp. NIES-53]